MPKVVRQDVDQLNAILTVTVEKSEYTPVFNTELDKYRRDAHLKGFRKGKAPAGLVRKMVGRNFLVNLVLNMMQEEIQKYLEEEKIQYLGQPLAKGGHENSEFDPQNLKDFTFEFEIGIAPEFTITGIDSSETYDRYDIEISQEMVEEEWTGMLARAAQRIDLEKAEQDGDVIKLELADMEPDSPGRYIFNTFSNFWKDLSESAQEALGKIVVGDTIAFDPTELLRSKDEEELKKYVFAIGADDRIPDSEAFFITVTSVTRMAPAEPDQEFFDQHFGEGRVSSEEEARDFLKEDLSRYFGRDADALLFFEIQKRILEKNQFPLPDAFLKRWLLAQKEEEEATMDQIEAEFPSFAEGLRWMLIKNKLANEYNVEVTEEDIRQRIAAQMMEIFGNSPYLNAELIDSLVERRMADEKEVNKIIDNILLDRILLIIKDQVTIHPVPISLEGFRAEYQKVQDELNARRKSLAATTAEEEE